MTDSNLLGPLLQGFFLEHLLQHKHASPRTVSAYRDSFRLLLTFLHKTTGKEPAKLRLTDLDVTSVLTFLDHLERERLNTVRSRNARLAAIRSFFRYVALHAPERLALVNQVLAVPQKRPERKLLGYLTRTEMDALLAAPDCSSWLGRRDHALLLCLYNTGARVSEIISVHRADICLDGEPSLQLRGKGRKERQVPLWTKTARVLRKWLGELAAAELPFVFPNARGGALARHGVAFIIAQNVQRASSACPSLALRKVSPHTIRHYPESRIMPSASRERAP